MAASALLKQIQYSLRNGCNYMKKRYSEKKDATVSVIKHSNL